MYWFLDLGRPNLWDCEGNKCLLFQPARRGYFDIAAQMDYDGISVSGAIFGTNLLWCVSLCKTHPQSQALVPVNMTSLGNRTFADVIK